MVKILNSLLPNSGLKKVGKAIRLFRYDLNQRPYNYTVEMTNRFKELHLIDTVPEELWTEVGDMMQEGGIKNILKKKKYKKSKWFCEEALQIAMKRREVKGKGEKERYSFECRVLKNSKEREESLPQRSMQRNKGKQQNGKD